MLSSLRSLIFRIRRLFSRRAEDDDFARELDSHLAMLTDENIRRGMPPQEARRAARLRLGGPAQLQETHRELWTFPLLESFVQDIRYAFRMLRKSPGFTAVAVLTLALGIGANTAIFSAVNGILLKPLPYADPSQLISITGFRQFPDGIVGMMDFPPEVWGKVREHTPAIAQMALYQSQQNFTLTGQSVPEVVPGVHVSSAFFSLLGAQPLLGRPILPGDIQPGAAPVVVVSYELWHADWGADPRVIGRTATLDGKQYTVIGVMPLEFEFPIYDGPRGLWLPLIVPPGQESGPKAVGALAVARLKKGATIPAVNSQLKAVSARLSADFTTFGKGGYFNAQGLKPVFGELDDGLLILLGAVGFVLLIACVNVSGLLLSRGWSRRREVAVREALGASRLRIVRQFLTESVLLALAGGVVGMLFSILGVHVLRAITPPDAPEHGQFLLDANVLWFTLAVSLLTGILFGLAPAVQASSRRIGATLKENASGSLGAFSGKHARRLRGLLAVVEIALAVVLVVGATLAARSFARLTAVKLGFRTDHILTMKANFSKSTCQQGKTGNLAACRSAVEDALRNMRAITGVQSAAVASTIPLSSWSIAFNLRIEGESQELELGSGEVVADRVVSPGYFRAMGIRLLSGREFDATDIADSGLVALVDESFAHKYLGDRPLGRLISNRKDDKGQPLWMDIVGVVSSARDLSPQEPPRAEIYLPFAQAPYFQGANFIVRTSESPMALIPAVQQAIWAVDKNSPITDLATMDQIVSSSFAQPKFQAILLGSFGGLGLLLAMVGIYGVISYSVTQRTHEIGVRMALGASRGDVLRMVMREGILLGGAGIVLGIAGALALTRFLQSLLFEIKPTDPATFVGVAISLALVALAAGYIPARRAMRVDPMVALRYE